MCYIYLFKTQLLPSESETGEQMAGGKRYHKELHFLNIDINFFETGPYDIIKADLEVTM